jgi:hypothetical protein
MGPFRWLTVNSPEGAQGGELVLESMSFAPAQTYQKALFDAGMPATAFCTEDISGGVCAAQRTWCEISLANRKAWGQLFL